MEPRRSTVIAGVLVFILPVLLHLQTIGFDFIWDDDANVTANALLVGEGQLRRIWTGEGIYQYYPLTFTTYWLQDRLIGLSAGTCHTINVLLHGLVSLGLFAVLRRLAVPGAFWGALLFGLHPLAVETVAWVTERKNLLSAVLALGSVHTYLRASGLARDRAPVGARPSGTGPLGPAYVASLLLFALAALAKTHVIVLPAFLLLLEAWREPKSPARAIPRLLPFFAVSASLAAVTVVFESRHVAESGTAWEWDHTLVERVLIAGRILGTYTRSVLWPHPLAFITDPWSVDGGRPGDWLPIIGGAAVILLLLGLATARRGHRGGSSPPATALPREHPVRPTNGGHPLSSWLVTARPAFRAALFVVLAYVLWLTPVLGFVPIYFMRYAYVQDHFAYFALLVAVPGVIAGSAALLGGARSQRFEPRATPTLLLFTAAGIVLAALSWRHAGDFRDAESLWTRTTEKSPRAWMAWTNLGVLRSEQGRHEEAVAAHRQAVAIDDRRAEPYVNLGYALEAVGDLDGAIEAYRRGIERRPDDPVAHTNFGNVLTKAGRFHEAIRAFETALAAERRYPQALNGLGVALARSGRVPAGVDLWLEALAVDPGFRDAFLNLGRALEADLSMGRALDQVVRASTVTEGLNPAIELARARVELRVGRMEEATRALDRAATAERAAPVGWLATAIEETRRAVP